MPIFKIEDYPIRGKLFLIKDSKIILRALAKMNMDNTFDYTSAKIGNLKEILKDANNGVINIKAEDFPMYYSWEFIPMNLDVDILIGEKGYVNPVLTFSTRDKQDMSGTFTPLANRNKEIFVAEVYK